MLLSWGKYCKISYFILQFILKSIIDPDDTFQGEAYLLMTETPEHYLYLTGYCLYITIP